MHQDKDGRYAGSGLSLSTLLDGHADRIVYIYQLPFLTLHCISVDTDGPRGEVRGEALPVRSMERLIETDFQGVSTVVHHGSICIQTQCFHQSHEKSTERLILCAVCVQVPVVFMGLKTYTV